MRPLCSKRVETARIKLYEKIHKRLFSENTHRNWLEEVHPLKQGLKRDKGMV